MYGKNRSHGKKHARNRTFPWIWRSVQWNQHLRNEAGEDTHTLTLSHCAPSQAVLTSLWTSEVTRGECSDNRMNLCGENDQRPQSVSNPQQKQQQPCGYHHSQTCCFTHTHTWTPLIPAQQRALLEHLLISKVNVVYGGLYLNHVWFVLVSVARDAPPPW